MLAGRGKLGLGNLDFRIEANQNKEDLSRKGGEENTVTR